MTPITAPKAVPLPSSLRNCSWCARCKAGARASKGNCPAPRSLTQGHKAMESNHTKLRGMSNVVMSPGVWTGAQGSGEAGKSSGPRVV